MFTLQAWLDGSNIWYGMGSDFFLFLGLYWSYKLYKKKKAEEE
tara:strand:- start:810 stop:938 length:129 start_codon:yes stop_codon:yes gene_type:complete